MFLKHNIHISLRTQTRLKKKKRKIYENQSNLFSFKLVFRINNLLTVDDFSKSEVSSQTVTLTNKQINYYRAGSIYRRVFADLHIF